MSILLLYVILPSLARRAVASDWIFTHCMRCPAKALLFCCGWTSILCSFNVFKVTQKATKFKISKKRRGFWWWFLLHLYLLKHNKTPLKPDERLTGVLRDMFNHCLYHSKAGASTHVSGVHRCEQIQLKALQAVCRPQWRSCACNFVWMNHAICFNAFIVVRVILLW